MVTQKPNEEYIFERRVTSRTEKRFKKFNTNKVIKSDLRLYDMR